MDNLPSPNVVIVEKPDPMLQFFQYEHLPPMLQAISKPFCDLAKDLVATLPRNPERTVALRKLLESKDCAVRSALYKENQPS
jgi:hypothetical protein